MDRLAAHEDQRNRQAASGIGNAWADRTSYHSAVPCARKDPGTTRRVFASGWAE